MAEQLRDHVERARTDPTTENLEAMWRSVFLRKAWYFVPAETEEGPNRPRVIELAGDPWLPACTSVRHYRAFTQAIGLDGDDSDEGHLHGLALDPSTSMQHILEVREVIAGVVFNPSTSVAIRAPVDALEAYADHFEVPLSSDPSDAPER